MRRSAILLVLFAILLAPASVRAQTTQPIVHAVMFWMAGCLHCEDVVQNVLPPLHERYGAQFNLLMIEVVDTQDIDTLYSVAASYNFPKEQTGVPFPVIGEQVLIGSEQVRAQLPGLIDDYLAHGGADWPENPLLADFLPAASPASSLTSDMPADSRASVISESESSVAPRNNGFLLANVIMGLMAITMLYSLASVAFGKVFNPPDWVDWLIPVFIIIGIGVAGYLSYVETQSIAAICGPVGDCNTVQQSSYARLFDVLPIGVFGLLGYLAMLATWLTRKYLPKLEKLSALAFWGMAFFAVIFSLYLTYLEPFVIRAVCIWCLTSAVVVTLLLLLGTPPATCLFSVMEDNA